jgi:hypothetical protein
MTSRSTGQGLYPGEDKALVSRHDLGEDQDSPSSEACLTVQVATLDLVRHWFYWIRFDLA